MKTIMKKEDGHYVDSESGKLIDENEILDFIKNDVEFRIKNEKDKRDITEAELAQILIQRTRKKSDAEKFFDSIKEKFGSGRSSASQIFQDMLWAGYGALSTTEQKAREFVDQMIESGRVSKEKGDEFFKKTVQNLQEREKEFEQKAKSIVQKRLSDIGIASAEKLESKIKTTVADKTAQLEKQIQALQKQIKNLQEKTTK